MKKTLMILGIILLIIALPFNSMLTESFSAQNGPIKEVKEGDVIFQTSQSQQSPLIQLATRSSISHCGIIIMKNGEPYVLETLKTLTTTPLEEFIARGKGGKYWLKRSNLENIKIEYEHYLGKPYDLAFKFDNDKFYCSELIYDIYKEQLGIELCKPKKVSDYFILGIDEIPQMERVMEKRGISKEQYVVAPVDVFESEYLKDLVAD
ncbi:MAG: hypothetical protein IKK07_09295 [Bacteroides sp.]|nr:hypothetical protein [Bacteroides sp.]